MQRYRPYEPSQTLMLPLDFEHTFPAGTYERFLVDTINGFDLSRFENCEMDAGGETPYDPRALLGIVFLGFSTGTFSSRRLSLACVRDIRYMFVGGGNAPEHSTICRFLEKYRDAIKDLFTQILYIADNIGLIDYRTIAIDGTKIKGNASRQFTGSIADFESKRARLDAQIKRALDKQKESDDTEEKQYWEAKSQRYAKNRKRIDSFLAQAVERRNEDGGERHQSSTDNDCRILKSREEYLCGYNAQVGIDVGSGLLLAAEVVDLSNDKRAFPVMAEAIRAAAPADADVGESAYLADNGYFSPDTFDYARGRDLDVYVSDRSAVELYEPPGNAKARIGSKDCRMESMDDGTVVLVCPGQLRIKASGKTRSDNQTVYRFRVGRNCSTCRDCAYFARCAGLNERAAKEFQVDERAVLGSSFMERHRQKLHSEPGKRLYGKRMSSVERVFGHLKANNGFSAFLRRGLDRVNGEWMILAVGFNLRRLFVLTNGYGK